MFVDFTSMFALTVLVAVGEEVAAAAALVILHAGGLHLNLAGYLPLTIMTSVSGREAILSDAERHYI